jgi:hypothetical protein
LIVTFCTVAVVERPGDSLIVALFSQVTADALAEAAGIAASAATATTADRAARPCGEGWKLS